MFDISFISTQRDATGDGEGDVGIRGRVTLGGFAEEFIAPVGFWTRADYERQWMQAARRFLAGADRTAFFTSAFQFRWTLWRAGDVVRVQEHYLGAAGFPEPIDPDDLYSHIADPSGSSEDGEPVSEWVLPLADVLEFARRVAGPSA